MSVANSYAKALFEAAIESKFSPEQLDQMGSQLGSFVQATQTSSEAKAGLMSPMTTSREKVLLVEEITKKLPLIPLLGKFILVLAKNGRLPLIGEIREAFRSVRLEHEGGMAGDLVSAEALDQANLDILAEAFGKKLGKKVVFRTSMDPSLLAGIKVTVNGVTYDGTLRSQLQKLRDRFVAGY